MCTEVERSGRKSQRKQSQILLASIEIVLFAEGSVAHDRSSTGPIRDRHASRTRSAKVGFEGYGVQGIGSQMYRRTRRRYRVRGSVAPTKTAICRCGNTSREEPIRARTLNNIPSQCEPLSASHGRVHKERGVSRTSGVWQMPLQILRHRTQPTD
jgi:hypothetical protein